MKYVLSLYRFHSKKLLKQLHNKTSPAGIATPNLAHSLKTAYSLKKSFQAIINNKVRSYLWIAPFKLQKVAGATQEKLFLKNVLNWGYL